MLTPYYKNFLETILHFAVPLTMKLTGPFVTSSDINSGTKNGTLGVLISLLGSSVLLRLTETHLTGLFSVCQMDEMFLEIHTYFLKCDNFEHVQKSCYVKVEKCSQRFS